MLEDELPSKFVLPINADALRSAMENILRNGLRQTPAGSRLSVTLTATSRFVRISLCDQGPGMPPEEIEHAFDPFVRGSHEQTGTGFGLGLAIAQRAVQAHFGRIEARNLPTGGFEPENRGIYTQSDSPKKSSRNIWSLAVVSVDQRY